ncbi:hypothetical protein HJFPF1_08595 [Paramyrothecium foliicola]|nr:hypothetical protein HJFPF1_08595 [Paramyrothecium foliicola]
MSNTNPKKQSPKKQDGPQTRKLPSWLDHFNVNDVKILTRCWIATWVAMLLTFIHPALVNIGQATFFCALVLFIVPPASIVFVYLLASLSLLLGMCLAWAWGLLTMKAALAARPESVTNARVQALQQEAAARAQQTGESVAWEAQILVHNGFMLDTRVTVIFYVMGSLFIYALSRLRCSNPKFLLSQLFGSIVTDIFILFGPTLPSFNASVASVLVKPGAIGIALGVSCCLLLFPKSASSVVLSSMAGLVMTMDTSVDAIRRALRHEKVPMKQLLGARARKLGIYKAMQPAVGFLPLDMSRGLWSADDVKGLHGPIREAMMASFSLLDVHISWITSTQEEEKLGAQKDTDDSEETAEKDRHSPGGREMMEHAQVMEALRSPEEASMHAAALSELRGSTEETLLTCSKAIKLAARSIQTVNKCRWIRKPTQQQLDQLATDLQQTVETLRAARARCVTETTEGVLKAYGDIFDEKGDLKHNWSSSPPLLRGIILAMVVEERILVAAEAVETLLESILNLLQTRKECRIWLPSRLQYAMSWFMHKNQPVPSPETFADADDDPDDVKEPESLSDDSKEAYHRLHVSHVHMKRRRGNVVVRAIVNTYRWLFNPAGLFALRMVVVTIATAIPSAIPNSAGFFYREKGIWAVITAQTCMVVYMADFTFSLFARAAGTVFGGVLGLVAWYIGSGSGPGNPYGMAAITAVMIFIILWLRIFLPPAYAKGTILAGATFLLVVGFSYDEGHILQYGLPGRGYEAFWKRLVTVLIGFVAATIVQIIPKPPSATKHVCKTLSKTVRTLSDHYALLLSHWGRREQQDHLRAVAEDVSIGVAEKLASLNEMISVLQFEMTSGPFDQETLKSTQVHCQAMNQALRRLLDLSTSLPVYLQDRLARTFGLLDDRMIGDVMAVLSIVEQSLMTGLPLPERLPTPLIGRFYDSWGAQRRQLILSKSLVRDEGYRRYCVAMSAYLKFLSTIDDLVLLLKQTLGENHVVHYSKDA